VPNIILEKSAKELKYIIHENQLHVIAIKNIISFSGEVSKL